MKADLFYFSMLYLWLLQKQDLTLLQQWVVCTNMAIRTPVRQDHTFKVMVSGRRRDPAVLSRDQTHTLVSPGAPTSIKLLEVDVGASLLAFNAFPTNVAAAEGYGGSLQCLDGLIGTFQRLTGTSLAKNSINVDDHIV